jgi:hypothetical protein
LSRGRAGARLNKKGSAVNLMLSGWVLDLSMLGRVMSMLAIGDRPSRCPP